MTNQPRAFTAEEARAELLERMSGYIDYWLAADGTEHRRMSGLVFSILNIFDGTVPDLPAYDIVLRPHPDDKESYIEHGLNWYESGMVINDCMLHEEWASIDNDAESV